MYFSTQLVQSELVRHAWLPVGGARAPVCSILAMAVALSIVTMLSSLENEYKDTFLHNPRQVELLVVYTQKVQITRLLHVIICVLQLSYQCLCSYCSTSMVSIAMKPKHD